ncbi:MAG TPA: winged helix DNA-binding domain-containing protein [Bryobacteraceae bacterium]
MTQRDIARMRLVNQQISCTRFHEPHQVVAALGAMQAQDYLGGIWAIGLRLPHVTETAVELAIAERKIIRTWPLRGTLHFVAAADIRWMIALLAPGMIAKRAGLFRQLELNESVLALCRKLLVKALRGNRQLTRDALMSLLESAKITTASLRGYHILWQLAHEGLLCIAAREGKQQTFALLDEWVPLTLPSLERDAALAELALRYFCGHGPATLRDFVWWTGLKVSDAKSALESVSSQLSRQVLNDTAYWMPRECAALAETARAAYLLPGFDEYLLGYRDRGAVLDPLHSEKVVPGGNGVFQPTIVINGRVTGTWKRTLNKNAVVITANPFKPLKKTEQNAFAAAAERYARFIGLPLGCVTMAPHSSGFTSATD